jgi:hypothetical protein
MYASLAFFLTRSTFESSAFDLQNIFRTGRPDLRDMECERIKCKWTIGAAGWALKNGLIYAAFSTQVHVGCITWPYMKHSQCIMHNAAKLI